MLSSQILEDYVVSIQVLLMRLLFFFSGWGLEEYLVGSFSPLQDCIHQSSLYLSINSGCSSLSSNGNGWHVIWTAKEAALEASSRVVKVIENSKYLWGKPIGEALSETMLNARHKSHEEEVWRIYSRRIAPCTTTTKTLLALETWILMSLIHNCCCASS